MSEAASAEGFWRFSLMVYARPGVAEALIGLQDGAGHNVFDDGCTIGAAEGGLVAFIKTLHLAPAFQGFRGPV